MYNFTAILVALLNFASGHRVLARTATTLAYDNHYDEYKLSLNDVSCSTGTNGLESKHYTTLGSLPAFPNLGAVYTVTGYDSSKCGACYAVTYKGKTINILAIDKSAIGFTVSETAMNTLTGGLAEQLGRVDVTFVDAPASACHM